MGMLIKIHAKEIERIEYHSMPVVPLYLLDELYARAAGTARHAFKRNRVQFVQGTDYFTVPYKVWSGIPALFKRFGSNTSHNALVLLTESGYLMLARTFRGVHAGRVQREMLETYFRNGRSKQSAGSVAVPLARYVELLEAENAFLRREIKGN